MSGRYSSWIPGWVGAVGGLGATTVLTAKVAIASAALAAAASLARVAVPQLVSGADAFLWKLYLFVTVHVIIFVIWKLSGSKHFHAAAHKDPWAPTPHHPAPPLPTEEVVLSAEKRKVEVMPAVNVVRSEEYRVPPLVSRPHIEVAASPVDEGIVSPGSCVTTGSEEDGGSSVFTASADVAAPDAKQSVAPARASVRERAVVERGGSLPSPPVVAATAEYFDGADKDAASGDDDLDATWNAIMQRMRPSTAPALSSSSHPAPRSPAQKPRRRAR